MFNCFSEQRGFTLIETTVALMISVALVGLGATIYNNNIDSLNIKKTADGFKQASETYFRYLNANKNSLSGVCDALLTPGNVTKTAKFTVTKINDNQCRLTTELAENDELNHFMDDGKIFPDVLTELGKNVYLKAGGVVTIKNKDSGQPKITSLLYTSVSEEIDDINLAKLAMNYGIGFGYVNRNGKLKGSGELLDEKQVSAMAGGGGLPKRSIYAIKGSGAFDVYQTQAQADDRYLARVHVANHPEMNRMSTDIDLDANRIYSATEHGRMTIDGQNNAIRLSDDATEASIGISPNSLSFNGGNNNYATIGSINSQTGQNASLILGDLTKDSPGNLSISYNGDFPGSVEARGKFELNTPNENDYFSFNKPVDVKGGINVSGAVKADSVTSPLLVLPQNKEVIEGDPCTEDELGHIIKSGAPYESDLIICRYIGQKPQIISGGFQSKMSVSHALKQVTSTHDSGAKLYSFFSCAKDGNVHCTTGKAPSYIWTYLNGDLNQDENMVVFWKNSGKSLSGIGGTLVGPPAHNTDTLGFYTIQLPSWYPYGAVEVCAYSTTVYQDKSPGTIFNSNDTDLLHGSSRYLASLFNHIPQGILTTGVKSVDAFEKDFQYSLHCSQLRPGQFYTDMIAPASGNLNPHVDWGFGRDEKIFALSVRYKGHLAPDVISLHHLGFDGNEQDTYDLY